MKALPSSRFRKTYPSLSEPVVVTVLGRPIGTYIPDLALNGRGVVLGAIAEAVDAELGRMASLMPVTPVETPK